jgi:predicted RNA-binding protein with PUA-like domain
MLEKDIENLLAQNPEIFFPKSGFKLIGQQVKLGRCYADIIFEDKHKRKVIVEVKRGILSRDASGQVTEYYGLLKSESPDDIVELILCANIIPPERKKFLEIVGIECKELGINLINQIADNVGYSFIKSEKQKKQISDQAIPVADHIWIFQANPQRYDIMNALADEEIGTDMHWLVNQHKNDIAKGHIGMIWLSGKESGIYAITEIVTDPQIMGEPEAERKYWTDSSDAEGEKLRVKMKIVKNMLNKPLTKETIKNKDGLQNLSILRQPRGTNFNVTSEEWNLIKELIEK